MRVQDMIPFLGVCLVSACAAQQPSRPTQPMSAAEHMAEADKKDRQAASLAEYGAAGEAGMMPEDAVTTSSGGVPLTRPRWTAAVSASTYHKREIARLRARADAHRRIAKGLRQVETRECAGLHPDEIDHGPFFHKDDIDCVEPVERDGRLVGARIRFRDVQDLTVEWMERAVSCAQARAAVLGYPKDDPSPLMRPGIRTQVTQRGAFIEVSIVTDDPDVARQVLDSARVSRQTRRESK